MITNLRTTRPVARKQHICMLCGCQIESGQKYERQTNIFDGLPYDFICHEECDSVAHKLDMYQECEYDEGLTSDFFKESVDEYIHDTHYDDTTDDNAADWLGLSKYEEVCKIDKELE